MTQFNNELYAGFLPEAGDARFEGKRGFYPAMTAEEYRALPLPMKCASPAIWDTRRSLPTRWRVKTALPFARQTSHSQDRRAGSLGQGHAAAITTYRRKK